MTLPTLSTTRLVLRPAISTDIDMLWEIWREPEVRRYLFDNIPVTRERVAEVFDHCLASVDDGLGLWTVGLGETSVIVGCVGLLRVTNAVEYDPSLVGAVELLAALSPTVWGRGYAHEALGVVIAHGFNSLGLSRLAAVTDVPNRASDRMVRRLGFKVTGECDGPRYRLRVYALTTADFIGSRKAPRLRNDNKAPSGGQGEPLP